jgi:MFS family permease
VDRGKPASSIVTTMHWPFNKRADPVHIWGTVAAGIAIYGIMVGALVALHSSVQRYHWWWPTNWIVVPVVITGIGALLLVVPVRRSVPERTTPGSDIDVNQHAKNMKGELVGVDAGQVSGNAKISVRQRIRKLTGNATGVKIDKIGS